VQEGFELDRYVAAIVSVRIEEPLDEVESRNVMVARHSKEGRGEGIEEMPCCNELGLAPNLSEVAAAGQLLPERGRQ
jgi:hypothetical protein